MALITYCETEDANIANMWVKRTLYLIFTNDF